jgi:hypothetical protein
VVKKRKHSPSPHEVEKRHCSQSQSQSQPIPRAQLQTPQACTYDSRPSQNWRSTEANHTQNAIQPKAGELYYAYHKKSQRWLAALVLPLTNLKGIGISGTIASLGLSRDVPNCVVFNVNSGEFEWLDGYGDGEVSSHVRKFPVVYFTGPRFPDRNAADWVPAEDLRILDENRLRASAVPYYRAVKAFLERRTLRRTFEARMGRSCLYFIYANANMTS